jgi:hypothetical protein
MAHTQRGPEIVDPAIEYLAWLLDESIPLGGRWRVGLDGVFGLIPGIGDLAGAAIGTLIVVRASMAGLPRATVLRMIVNLGIDAALGSIPIFGDVFDFAYKSNLKNVRLYREALQGERRVERDWAFLLVVLSILGALLAVPLLTLIWLVERLA